MDKKQSILIVDDLEINRAVMKHSIDIPNVDIFTAKDSNEAIQILLKNNLSLIILDLVMPGMSGIELLKKIRIKYTPNALPIIIVTGKSNDKVIVEALDAGANDFLSGFVNKEILNSKIKMQLKIKKITEELEISETEAKKASEIKSMFVANMGHEIRTPLNVIIGITEILKESTLTKEQLEYIDIFEQSTDNLLSIINDILDLSKIESHKVKFEKIDFCLRKTLKGIITMFSPRTKSKGLYLNLEIDESVPNIIIGDPVKLRQIIINLLSNAIKFTEKGGITVKLHVESERLFYSVRDTGMGIEEKKRKIIFSAFTQADSSTTRQFGGTGLGLTICKKIITLLGGHLDVESEIGVGSNFKFDVPLTRSKSDKIAVEEDTFDYKKILNEKKWRILLTDDTEDIRKIIVHHLSKFNIEITQATNGLEAIKHVEQKEFDLILMDIQMPELDGFGAIRKLRGDMGIKVPIIALTAFALKEHGERLEKLGCSKHLTKPIKKKKLLEEIAISLKNH